MAPLDGIGSKLAQTAKNTASSAVSSAKESAKNAAKDAAMNALDEKTGGAASEMASRAAAIADNVNKAKKAAAAIRTGVTAARAVAAIPWVIPVLIGVSVLCLLILAGLWIYNTVSGGSEYNAEGTKVSAVLAGCEQSTDRAQCYIDAICEAGTLDGAEAEYGEAVLESIDCPVAPEVAVSSSASSSSATSANTTSATTTASSP